MLVGDIARVIDFLHMLFEETVYRGRLNINLRDRGITESRNRWCPLPGQCRPVAHILLIYLAASLEHPELSHGGCT
jgi:hypothetical protein